MPVTVVNQVERILDEVPIGICAAAKRLGTFRNGRPTHPSTVTRWVTRGIVLPDGRNLKLEAIKLNGRFVTSVAAVVRFVAAQQHDGPDGDGGPESGSRTPSRRRHAAAQAVEELRRLGV